MVKIIQILAVMSVGVAGLSLAFPLAASAGWFGFGDPSCSGNASDVKTVLSEQHSGVEITLKNIRTLGKKGNRLSCAAEMCIGSCSGAFSTFQQYYWLSLTDEGKLWIEWYPY